MKTNTPEVNLRKNTSEVPDNKMSTVKHFTQSQNRDMASNDDKCTDATVQKNKQKSSSEEFTTKTIPEKKRKQEVDAVEIIKTHSKKGRAAHDEEKEVRKQEISKKTDRKEYSNRRGTRHKSGFSDDSAQPSTSSGGVAAQSVAGIKTRSKSKRSSDNDTSTSHDVQNTQSAGSSQDGFSCHICQQMFRNYDELKIHKVKCTKNPKKHFCSVCGKGFHARSLMQQHYDFRHTNKPKRFVCNECNKAFELKKSYDEHMMRLHNKGDYNFSVISVEDVSFICKSSKCIMQHILTSRSIPAVVVTMLLLPHLAN